MASSRGRTMWSSKFLLARMWWPTRPGPSTGIASSLSLALVACVWLGLGAPELAHSDGFRLLDQGAAGDCPGSGLRGPGRRSSRRFTTTLLQRPSCRVFSSISGIEISSRATRPSPIRRGQKNQRRHCGNGVQPTTE